MGVPLLISCFLILYISSSFILYFVIPNDALGSGLIHAILFVMVIWSLFACSTTDPGYVDTYFKFNKLNEELSVYS